MSMLKFLLNLFKKDCIGDLSQHRKFTVTKDSFRYEDLCQ